MDDRWPEDRMIELSKLETLLREVVSIDHGSDCLRRIQTCIDLAAELKATDLTTGRPSFMRFLIAIAAGATNG